MSGVNYAAFEHRSMMQVMLILVADKSALQAGKAGELAALGVRAFRMYATFYKAFLGVSEHTDFSLAIARAHAIKHVDWPTDGLCHRLVEILPQAYPDHASNWRFSKIHMIVHLLDNVIMRGMPHHYSTKMWEHTHKGTVKIPIRGSNWKDIPRRIVEEEVQREICREVAQDAGGGRQYATALREAVETIKLVLTRKGRTMRPAEEGDAVVGTYRTALGDLMDALPGSMVAAKITTAEVVVRTHLKVTRKLSSPLYAMARKRKSAAESANVTPRDLYEIPYIAWMNKQLSAGRKPSGPQPVDTPSRGDTSYQAPRDIPMRGCRNANRMASSRSSEANTYEEDEDDADYNEETDGTDNEADSGEEPDKGMSDSDAESDDDDAPEESQPATPPVRRGHAKAAPGDKSAAKGGEPPRRAPKTRDPMTVKRSLWSLKESTILVAARWFMKDELEPLLGKQGSQYWACLMRHIETENTGWVRGVNAVQRQ
ncbi:unnamed protein product [Closterium sp. Yama58-4]|nr:unnamed protein product [Closterium sp. Yama58-4]